VNTWDTSGVRLRTPFHALLCHSLLREGIGKCRSFDGVFEQQNSAAAAIGCRLTSIVEIAVYKACADLSSACGRPINAAKVIRQEPALAKAEQVFFVPDFRATADLSTNLRAG
jgi:hypothetical protein